MQENFKNNTNSLRDVINSNWDHLKDDQNNISDNVNVSDSANIHNVGGEIIPGVSDINSKDHNKKSVFFYFFIFSVVFLLLASLFAFYQYYFDKNSISTEKIDMSINIENSVPSGQNGVMNINLTNNNKSTISNSRLELNYQKGVGRSGVVDVVNRVYNFGDIFSGAYIATSSDYLFVGGEGEEKNIKATLYYKVAGSNAEYYKVLDKKVTISKPSILIDILSKSSVIDDHETTLKFKIKNISLEHTSGLNFKVEVPPGFVVEKKDENISPLEVILKDIKIGDSYEYSITGYFKNKLSESKVFRGYVSSADNNSVYVSTQKEIISISSPISIGGSAKINNQLVSEYVTDEIIGSEKELYLTLKNISENVLTDLAVFVDVNTGEKFTFNKDNTPDILNSINPKEEKNLSVYIKNIMRPNTIFNIEIYGKMRGDFDSIFLKRQVVNMPAK